MITAEAAVHNVEEISVAQCNVRASVTNMALFSANHMLKVSCMCEQCIPGLHFSPMQL